MLDDMQTAACDAPFGDYTITEDIPADQVLLILCQELPAGSMVDSATGTLGFTVASEDDSVDCLFINSAANTVVRVTDEPAGANCPNGGVKIETGTDSNGNGVLDAGEVSDTSYVCNGAAGENGTNSSGCAIAGSGPDTGGLGGLFVLMLVPAAVAVRKKYRKKN